MRRVRLSYRKINHLYWIKQQKRKAENHYHFHWYQVVFLTFTYLIWTGFVQRRVINPRDKTITEYFCAINNLKRVTKLQLKEIYIKLINSLIYSIFFKELDVRIKLFHNILLSEIVGLEKLDKSF